MSLYFLSIITTVTVIILLIITYRRIKKINSSPSASQGKPCGIEDFALKSMRASFSFSVPSVLTARKVSLLKRRMVRFNRSQIDMQTIQINKKIFELNKSYRSYELQKALYELQKAQSRLLFKKNILFKLLGLLKMGSSKSDELHLPNVATDEK